MKTMRVMKCFNPTKLHNELAFAGIPIVTIRAGSPNLDEPAVYGVLVLQDSADLDQARVLVDAHEESRPVSRVLSPEAIEAALNQMEKL